MFLKIIILKLILISFFARADFTVWIEMPANFLELQEKQLLEKVLLEDKSKEESSIYTLNINHLIISANEYHPDYIKVAYCSAYQVKSSNLMYLQSNNCNFLFDYYVEVNSLFNFLHKMQLKELGTESLFFIAGMLVSPTSLISFRIIQAVKLIKGITRFSLLSFMGAELTLGGKATKFIFQGLIDGMLGLKFYNYSERKNIIESGQKVKFDYNELIKLGQMQMPAISVTQIDNINFYKMKKAYLPLAEKYNYQNTIKLLDKYNSDLCTPMPGAYFIQTNETLLIKFGEKIDLLLKESKDYAKFSHFNLNILRF